LAHDIVREKPGQVGLEEKFSIIDEREAGFIRREAVNAWLGTNSLDEYFDPEMDDSKREWVKRKYLPDLLDALALAFIRSSKDRLLTPDDLRARLDGAPAPLPLAELGWSIYADYQRALAYRGAVDFDDLIRLALILLESDREYLQRLQYRYPFILEDEAQDSSRTQERILTLLSGSMGSPSPNGRADRGEVGYRVRFGDPDKERILTLLSVGEQSPSPHGRGDRGEVGNWVRVGDPNQAIFETFTTASPELLRAFIRENPSEDMPESGRSQPSILALANHLIDWVMNSHPIPEARMALSLPHILPVPQDDPQQNPPADPGAIKFIGTKFTPEQEVEAVVRSVKDYLESFTGTPVEEQPTIAILVPRNARGVEVVNALRKRGIEPIELIASTSETRAAAGSLSHLLAYLADPQSAKKLSKAYEVWRRDWREDSEKMSLVKQVCEVLKRIGNVEDYVSPITQNWSPVLEENDAEGVLQELAEFRIEIKRWLNAVTLPVDQLVLTLAQDVFTEASDLALAHKLALVLRQVADDHIDWRLPELATELVVIAKNERRFIGFSSDDSGFDPDRHRGRVVVSTMHKAKGLEWDRVYLVSVNNYDFPSNMPNDTFISERWYVRNELNLEAEALAQLDALESKGEFDWYQEGAATMRSRLDYVKERLRLFYVGITRAKKDLIVTWNTGRQGET
jgi:DNA helicase-2/ATP-dependent DNA helicase PcrA